MTHIRLKPPGQQRTYGVLVGSIKDGQMDPSGRSPHYEVWVQADHDYRIAVNAQSVDGSDVLALYFPSWTDPTRLDLEALAGGSPGFTPLQTGPNGQGLDYVRDGLFDPNAMAPIPAEGSGVTLANLLDAQIQRAKSDPAAVVIAVGQYFSDPGSDQSFGFSPERGVHDIHMMQGNSGSFASDNMVRGDGALFIRYGDGGMIALFLRFTTQSTTTDGQTGNPV